MTENLPGSGGGEQTPAFGSPNPSYGTPGGQPPSYGTQPPGYGSAPPPSAQPPAGYPAATVSPVSQADERQWSMLAHLGGVLGILPSLIIFLVFKDRGPFVKDQSREALNFQITALIGYLVLWVVSFVLPVPLNFVLWVAVVVLSVMGGMAANKGETYRYPFALRLIT